jgi:hypothetical protein
MTDTMPDDTDKPKMKVLPTWSKHNPSNAKKRSDANEIPTKTRLQRTNQYIAKVTKTTFDSGNELNVQKYKPGAGAGADVICDFAHDTRCDGTCVPRNRNLLLEQLYPEEKICFPSFDDVYSNCNMKRTKFENMFRVSPDQATLMKAGHGVKMHLNLYVKPRKEDSNLTNKKLTFLENRLSTKLVQQCYDQNRFSCNESAFVSKVPFVCECSRTPFFHLTQEKFYAVVVQSFEAHPARTKLS